MSIGLFSRGFTVGKRGQGMQTASSGFTLIEVVLALTIFALMGGILYGAFSLSHSAVEKSEANSTRNQKQRVMTELLGNYIRSSFPYRESAQDQTIFFSGESDSVTFVSAYSQAMGGRGMAKIHIAKEEDSNGRASLKLEESAPVRINAETGAAGPSHSIVLQADMREVRFAYLDPQGDDENWQERWDGREQRALPRGLRISYLNGNGQEVRWIFPLMMTVLAP
ncbi:MAG: prepilin-type N-terminal cleavage/methylation domain-containing protein [Candidatus Binatia bacterium]